MHEKNLPHIFSKNVIIGFPACIRDLRGFDMNCPISDECKLMFSLANQDLSSVAVKKKQLLLPPLAFVCFCLCVIFCTRRVVRVG